MGKGYPFFGKRGVSTDKSEYARIRGKALTMLRQRHADEFIKIIEEIKAGESKLKMEHISK